VDDREALAGDHSDNDGACNRLMGVIKGELERLAAEGMHNGYTWSSVVNPLIWT
jgi:hypothetical protein